MKLKKIYFIFVFLCCIVFAISCSKKENRNTVVPTPGLDPRIETFFNAVGIPLKEMDGTDMESVTADLTRVSPLFTNALPPKDPDNTASAPFFTLAKNVGLYFTSQIWKTQFTGPEDVKFFDLSKDFKSSSKINYKSENFNLPFVFLNSYAATPEKKQYLGSVLNGEYGKYENPMSLRGFHAMSHLYIMEYKLRDENGSRSGENARIYYALVSVPVTAGEHRLIMYAHAGDFGTSSSEIITIFNDKLKDFVVVTPLLPGEPLCTQINVQGQGCFRLDEKNNLVKDNIGQYSNPYINEVLNSIVPIEYPRSPIQEDINAFLGAHNTVSRIMNLSHIGSNHSLNPLYAVLKPFEHPERLVNFFQNLDDGGARMVPEGNSAPETIGVGSSRGGGVLLASLARIGFIMNGISLDTQFKHVVNEGEKRFEFQYPLFNGAALFFPPTSMLTGKMRLFTIMLLQNKLDAIVGLPMARDLADNEYFTNFRNDKNYLTEIQPPLSNEAGEIVGPAQDSLTRLVTFVAASDVTFLAPFLATALQNWNTYSNDEAMPMRAPGSLIFLHGSQDTVVPITESTIGMQAMNTVWAGLYNTSMDPYGNYLHDSQFVPMHAMLKSSYIPGVGAAQFTFQPTNEFFNEPCNKSDMAGIQQPNVIYNSDVGRCFGAGFSPKADGKNTVGKFYGHFDASFFTGRLVNSIVPKELHLSFLSSNSVKNFYNKNYTMEYDAGMHMKYGGPLIKEGETCFQSDYVCKEFAFPYNVAGISPTFMRYMSEEGNPSTDIVSAKKQIFEGEFKPNNTSSLQPRDVFLGWLESVACDWCEVDSGINDAPVFQQHFGVFHDFAKKYPLKFPLNTD